MGSLHRLLPSGNVDNDETPETNDERRSVISPTPRRNDVSSLPHDRDDVPTTRYACFSKDLPPLLTSRPIHSFVLSKDVLDHLVEVYSTSIHLQPLPLFDSEELEQVRQMRPRRYLLDSFCALSFLFSDDSLYGDQQTTIARQYAKSAREVVIPLASDASPRTDILRALCLLALYDMKCR